MAVVAILAWIAVPGAARVGPPVSSAEAAGRLALVLSAAQAEAQSRSASVRVEVDGGGAYVRSRPARSTLMSGGLGTRVASLPGGVVGSADGDGPACRGRRVREPATSVSRA